MEHRTFEEYLAGVPEPQRSTLRTTRDRILELCPEAEECVAYGVPAFRVDGVVFAGLAARRQGCSYYPMSGSLLDGVDVASLGLQRTKGALQFPADQPLSPELLRTLITTRLAHGR